MEHTKKFPLLLLVLVVGAALVFYMVGHSERRNIEKNWDKVSAMVTSVTKSKEENGKYDYMWHVTYTYKGIKRRSVLEEKGSSNPEKTSIKNEVVMIYVNPKNPEEIAEDTFNISIIKDEKERRK